MEMVSVMDAGLRRGQGGGGREEVVRGSGEVGTFPDQFLILQSIDAPATTVYRESICLSNV